MSLAKVGRDRSVLRSWEMKYSNEERHSAAESCERHRRLKTLRLSAAQRIKRSGWKFLGGFFFFYKCCYYRIFPNSHVCPTAKRRQRRATHLMCPSSASVTGRTLSGLALAGLQSAAKCHVCIRIEFVPFLRKVFFADSDSTVLSPLVVKLDFCEFRTRGR